MKGTNLFACLLATIFISSNIFSLAQSNPGTTNLKHQWTFDNGSANDAVATNPVKGTLIGGASIANKALVLSAQGQYLSFSGTALALNTYPVISQEIWFTPTAGANGNFVHLAFFGRTVNNSGSNFLFMMPARADNESRTAISNGDLSSQVFVRGPEYDDGKLHQFISVVRSDSLFFYIDGKLVDKVKSNVPLSGISTSLAYLGKSGYTADPTWIGSISKYSIYNKSLSASEVSFLYKSGAESNPVIICSAPSLDFSKPGVKNVAVWAKNLGQNISVTAPNNFSLSTTSLLANVYGDSLAITYSGTANVSGYVYLKSGNTKDSIFVKGSINPGIVVSKNRIVLDEFNSSATFNVCGNNLNSSITLTAPSGISLSPQILEANSGNVEVTVTYDARANSSGKIVLKSGATTTEITLIAQKNSECFVPLYPENLITDPTLNTDASGTGSRSINTNPDYVYCGSRSGEAAGNGTIERNLSGKLKPNTQYRVRAKVYKNHPQIKPGNMGCVTYTLAMDSAANPDKYRLIKIAMDSACAYYNKYTPFVKDIWVYYDAGIPTAQASYLGSIGFGSNTTYMWVGTAIHEMAHYFGSGTTTTWQSLMSTKVWAGAAGTAFLQNLSGEVLKGDTQHYWPYGINYKSEITNLGSQAVQHTALINAVKLIKAMLVDDCKFPTNNTSTGIGISGYDQSSADIYKDVAISKSWETIDFTFTTGATIGSNPKVYFKSDRGYIDNWEMYEVKAEKTFNLTLASGWNLVSIPIAFVDMSVLKVFPNAETVKNMTSFYYSKQPTILNTLQIIEPGKGYLVYNTKTETIQIKGYELSNTILGIENTQGSWKMIGTLSIQSILIQNALNQQQTEVEMIKNFDGFWEKGGMSNSLDFFEPGKGYFVR